MQIIRQFIFSARIQLLIKIILVPQNYSVNMVLTRSKSEEKMEKLLKLGQDGKTPVKATIRSIYDSDSDDSGCKVVGGPPAPVPAPVTVTAPAPAPAPAPTPAPTIVAVAKKSLGDKIKSFLFVLVVLALLFGFLIPELRGAFDDADVTPPKNEVVLDTVDEL